jgi:hypothetical protein
MGEAGPALRPVRRSDSEVESSKTKPGPHSQISHLKIPAY